jgi:hypothetical protein
MSKEIESDINREPNERPEEELDKLSPQKLLQNFTKNRVTQCVGIAFAVHLVIICGTSPRFIYESINPEAKARRIEREQKEAQLSLNARLAASAPPLTTGKVDKASSEGAGDKPITDAERKESAVYKEVTEAAGDDEIPDVPDDIDISLEDTTF